MNKFVGFPGDGMVSEVFHQTVPKSKSPHKYIYLARVNGEKMFRNQNGSEIPASHKLGISMVVLKHLEQLKVFHDKFSVRR